ncbi:rod shape-determining protein MreC [Dinoroseobacter sp. PD6]|uniref:rod shape-determining protein MreC n=1 Tax=Dinoroseobacter sp. PD6 TaxID=3028384 RepID=UPI00237B4CC5|nr:rod shape-determining protein MreC [Dinoroseobacter sp. PD6]MDD9717547.1 rod shape-determining protein MreC [Dinoroseobacter sp. PD6]
MARHRNEDDIYFRPIRRVLIGCLVMVLLGLFAFWRIDSPRVEQMRMSVIERVVPNLDWVMAPITAVSRMAEDFQSYARLFEQNEELRRELQQMKAWREAALQLEQENAQLLGLNNVRIEPELTFITGVVTADSGSPFRRSVLLNVGSEDGVQDGWATMDGLGLVGRIAGTAPSVARVLLLTDPSSRVPVILQPSGQRAMLVGDNSAAPLIDFIEAPEQVRAGDRVVTSGDGGVFPAELLAGQVAIGPDRRFRLRLAADYERLKFLRVLRGQPTPALPEAAPIDGIDTPPIAALEERADG